MESSMLGSGWQICRRTEAFRRRIFSLGTARFPQAARGELETAACCRNEPPILEKGSPEEIQEPRGSGGCLPLAGCQPLDEPQGQQDGAGGEEIDWRVAEAADDCAGSRANDHQREVHEDAVS